MKRIRLISLKDLIGATMETVGRFKVISLLLVFGAANHLYMEIFENESFKYYSRNIFMSILLLLPVLYSLQMLLQSGWIKRVHKRLLEGLALLLAALYFWHLPDSQLLASHFSQFWLYQAISLLTAFVCVKSFVENDDMFWHFHISLFSRANITFLYTSVIIAGTGAALGAIDLLFKTELLEHQETRIVILTLWLFTPLFFLKGIPSLTETQKVLSYRPIWIKNIGLYVLIPLTSVYLSILYAYAGKIAFQWKLPDGMVSYLILSFAAFGITTLILVYPFQKDENSKWTYWFGRLFYYLQFPLLILLSVAIYRRVMDYGITFRRFYVLLLALWLLLITLFMVYRKNRNLVAIPFSLLLLVLSSSFGPWSAFNVSFKSQKSRLDNLLEKNGLVVDGELKRPEIELSKEIKGEISSITKYLFDYGKLNVYSNLLPVKDTLTPKVFAEQLGFKYSPRRGSDFEDNEWFNYSADINTIPIGNGEYDYLVKMRIQPWEKKGSRKTEQESLKVEYLSDKMMFIFSNENSSDSLGLPMKEIVDDLKRTANKSTINEIIRENEYFRIVCLFNKLSGSKSPEGIKLNHIDVDFLIKQKDLTMN